SGEVLLPCTTSPLKTCGDDGALFSNLNRTVVFIPTGSAEEPKNN
ncbi:MAG: hypothetical protein ACI909_003528, partial [Planctomycetota bacterium]